MKQLAAANAVYRLALYALPSQFRRDYGEELQQMVAAELREESGRGCMRTWSRLVHECVDVWITAVRVRVEGRPAMHARENNQGDGMLGALRNLRISARTLGRQPSFTLAAILTLGAGVGCAATAFGVWDALLLQPLPHPASERLVMVWRDLPRIAMARAPMSYPTLTDLREQTADSWAGLEAYAGGASALLRGGVEPEQVTGARVTGGVFGLLGNPPLVGRTIGPDDDRPGAEAVVVLSHALWRRYFGGDPQVLGRTIEVRERPHRVVGVMGPEFVFPSARSELWVALRADPEQQQRDVNYLVAVGRLRQGETLTRAQSRLDLAFTRLAQAYPDAYEDSRLWLEPRHEFVVGDARRVLLLGAGAAALLLMIACANLGNLLLVRGLARSRELAVRSALGATRARVAGELISEAAVLAIGGALLAVAVVFMLTRMIVVLAPDALPRRFELGVDARVIVFAGAVALFCALACAIAPVLLRFEPARSTLATAGGSVSQRGRTLQGGFLIAQVSLALVLLVITGLLTSTLTRLLGVPVGFDGDRVLTAHLALPNSRYGSADQIAGFYDQLFARVAALPGVERVGGTWALPFSEDYASSSFIPAGSSEREPFTVSAAPIRGDYFGAVGMRMLRGRNFAAGDRADGESVGIVNETLANRFWPNQDPIGKRMVDPEDPSDVVTVIGVVSDVRRRDLASNVELEVYLPHAQAMWTSGLYVTVRTQGDPLASSSALRAAVHALDPLLPVTRMATLDALVTRSVATPRFRAAIIAAVSAVAVLLTLLGIYSVQAVFVATYRRDLAVRLALGARPGRVIAEVVGRGLRLTLIGTVIGGTLAVIASRSLQALLFQVSPLDPATWLTAITLFSGVAALACWLPARRVGGLDPMLTLRSD